MRCCVKQNSSLALRPWSPFSSQSISHSRPPIPISTSISGFFLGCSPSWLCPVQFFVRPPPPPRDSPNWSCCSPSPAQEPVHLGVVVSLPRYWQMGVNRKQALEKHLRSHQSHLKYPYWGHMPLMGRGSLTQPLFFGGPCWQFESFQSLGNAPPNAMIFIQCLQLRWLLFPHPRPSAPTFCSRSQTFCVYLCNARTCSSKCTLSSVL